MAFTVRIQSSAPRKIETIKEVRALIGCGLKDAKDLVEAPPFTVPAGNDRATADEIAARFRGLGLTVDIIENDQVVDAATMPSGEGPIRVVVDQVGSRKIQVIKLIRDITQLDLLNAKNLVDRGRFSIDRELDRDRAEHVVALLAQAGAIARMVRADQPAVARTGDQAKPAKPPPSKIGPIPY